MRLFAFICAFLFALQSFGATVLFKFQTSDMSPQGLRSITLYPVGTYTNGNGSVITRDRMGRTTDTNGFAYISNLYGLTYRGELQGTRDVTTNWYAFPVTNGTINAADWTTNIPGVSVPFTLTAADARYVGKTGDTMTGVLTNRSGIYGSGIGITNLPFTFQTNETHVQTFIGTNVLFVNGGGDAGVNGTYLLKGTVNGITVWTNLAGTFGVAFDPSLHFFNNEQNITNSSGSQRYEQIGTSPFPQTGTWIVDSGTAPGPTVVVGTNSFTTSVVAYSATAGIGPVGVSEGTNIYYVSFNTGNDTNAVTGRRDRPWQNLTNVLTSPTLAVHSNDIVYLLPGTNYFGEFDITVSNGVSIVGLGLRDSCWLGKAASKVDLADIALRPGHGCTFANFAGNITTGTFTTTNVTLNNLHLIGYIDCLLTAGASTAVVDGGVYEVNGNDGSGANLIDAAVIGNTAGGGIIVKNAVFISRRLGNGNTQRRAMVIKGGTNVLTGCTFIATDTTNSTANTFGCIGLWTQGSGYSIISGCSSLVYNTNANNVCAFTNGFNASDLDTPTILPTYLVYSNGVAWFSGHTIATNFIGGQLYTNVYGTAIDISATISNVVANAAGASRHALWLRPIANSGVTGRTNRFGDYHQAMGATVVYTNLGSLNMRVPAGWSFAFTNESTTAGNDSQVTMGQISFP